MLKGVKFTLPEKLYLRDPQETKYGQKLLNHSVILLADMGFEAFNFKRLATSMSSSETSIYRYFENKHNLLLYLNSWYWEWIHYCVDMKMTNITDPKIKLNKVINSLIHASTESNMTEYINENLLHRIIVMEGSKSYHIHDVDKENNDGFFKCFKELINKIGAVIREVNPAFPYPRSLASSIFEMINNQTYYVEHLPKLTDLQTNKYDELEDMVNFYLKKLLQ